MTDITGTALEELFSALGDQLEALDEPCELVVIGGSGLLALDADLGP